MVASASSTPLHSPPVKGCVPYLNTMGLPLFIVSSNSFPLAVALHTMQHQSCTVRITAVYSPSHHVYELVLYALPQPFRKCSNYPTMSCCHLHIFADLPVIQDN